jgi:predicted Zn-dependent protease
LLIDPRRNSDRLRTVQDEPWLWVAVGDKFSESGESPRFFDRIDSSMSEKSHRRLMLEQSLAEEPTDLFLRYGLAIQCLREGDVEEGRQRLLTLIAEHPENQVAAYQQLAQSYADTAETQAAVATLRTGIAKAQAAGDWHAAAEMQQMFESLE